MSEDRYSELTEFQLDALRELGNIGAGQSAIALTDFLNRSTYMSIPNVSIENSKTINKVLRVPESDKVALITIDTIKDLEYTLFVIFDNKSVEQIITLMIKKSESTYTDIDDLNPVQKSLIKEMGSIILLKYVKALNEFLDADSFPSPPKFQVCTLDTVEHMITDTKIDVSKLLVIECDVYTTERNIAADLVILPHKDTFSKFMDALF